MTPAAIGRRREGFEHRPQRFHRLLIAADHQAVAFGQAPHAAAGAAVDVVHAGLGQARAAAHGFLVVGIAAVDDGVAGRQQRQQRIQGVVDHARRHHHPDDARRRQRGHHRLQGIGNGDAALGRLLARGFAGVVAVHAVSAAGEAFGHVGAHAAQADHCQFHKCS